MVSIVTAIAAFANVVVLLLLPWLLVCGIADVVVVVVVSASKSQHTQTSLSALCKVDLVPKEVVAKWLKHLRRSFPAIAFKASTQENSSSIKQTKVSLTLSGNFALQRWR